MNLASVFNGRSVGTVLLLLASSIGTTGCLGYADPDFLMPSSREEHVRNAAEAFGANLRWNRHEYAAALVNSEERTAFLMLVRDPKAPVQFTDFELLNVDLGDKMSEATALMSFKLYRLPSTTEVQLLDEQKWVYNPGKGNWFLSPSLERYRDAGKDVAADTPY